MAEWHEEVAEEDAFDLDLGTRTAVGPVSRKEQVSRKRNLHVGKHEGTFRKSK